MPSSPQNAGDRRLSVSVAIVKCGARLMWTRPQQIRMHSATTVSSTNSPWTGGSPVFFHRYVPWMSLSAGVELERRAADRREGEKDRELTRQTAGAANRAAVAAIIVAIAMAVASWASLIWRHFT